MTEENLSGPRKSNLKFWLTCAGAGAIVGAIVGATGFSFSEAVEAALQSPYFQNSFGFDPATPLDAPTLIAALFMVFMCLLQGGVIIAARLNVSFSRRVGIEAQFGDGRKGRAALWPLGLFWLLNGVFLALLAYAELATLSPPASTGIILLGSGLIVVAFICARRLWSLLDELLRNIWLESTALTCAVMLGGAMMMSLAVSLDILAPISLLQAILVYNYLYMVIYFAITLLRAPATFTNPTLEGE
jgi:hypothetical protein